jgi:hypothetical protein
MGNRGRQEAPADGNGKGSEDDNNKGAKESKGNSARATMAMTETSPREEGDNEHTNQLCTKVAAMARTVLATTGRAKITAARAMMTHAKRAMAMAATTAMTATMAIMAMTVMMMPNDNNDTKW